METTTSKLARQFTHCGLNADWCVSAWCVKHSGQGPNLGRGVYITDNEDETYSVVSRDFDEDELTVVLTLPDSQIDAIITKALSA